MAFIVALRGGGEMKCGIYSSTERGRGEMKCGIYSSTERGGGDEVWHL